MNVEIYTRAEHCPFCLNAKTLLKERGLAYSEKVAGIDLTREALKSEVFSRSGVEINTVPVIFIDSAYVGGFTDLVEYFERMDIREDAEMDDFIL